MPRTGRPGRWPAELGLSQSAVSRIWRAFGLKPHRSDAWKLSHRPAVHRQGPRRRRALPRPARGRHGAVRGREVPDPGPGPHRAGAADDARHPGRQTHDYIRHGTTSLFAALDVATGKVIGQLHAPAPRTEFKRFLTTIDRAGPGRPGPCTSCWTTPPPTRPRRSNAGCSPTPASILHFTPTSSSWLNLVERWFAELTNRSSAAAPTAASPTSNADIRAWIDDLERRPQALRLDQDRRRDPRHHRPLLHPN